MLTTKSATSCSGQWPIRIRMLISSLRRSRYYVHGFPL